MSDTPIVKFRIVGGPAPKDVVARVATLLALEADGLTLLSKRPVPPDSQLEVRIPESGGEKTLMGKVSWTTEQDGSGDCRIRVQLAGTETDAPGLELISSERRRWPRKPAHGIVKLRCLSRGMLRESGDRGGMLHDLSKGGMRIDVSTEYPPTTILEIIIPEGTVGAARTLQGKVAWIGPAEKPGRYYIGIAFVKLAGPVPPEGL